MDLAMMSHLQQMNLVPQSAGADKALDPASVTAEQADRFQALMANGPQTPPVQNVPEHQDHNIVAKAATEQADYYRQVPSDVMYLTQHMSQMSLQKVAAANMTVQLEIASLNADLQVKMAAVHSSKDAVQTLMKNQ